MFLDKQISYYLMFIFISCCMGSSVIFWFLVISGTSLFEDLDTGDSDHEFLDPIGERIADNAEYALQDGLLFYWDWENYWSIETLYYNHKKIVELNEGICEDLKKKDLIYRNEWDNLYFMFPETEYFTSKSNIRYNLKKQKDIYGLYVSKKKKVDLFQIFKC